MVSVCIATYNGADYILEQLTSILMQLDENDEVIVSDDCSTDETIEIIHRLNDKRIKLFTGVKYPSLIFNFENAIKKSSGDFVFLSDQDDVWLPGKVQKMTDLLKTNDLVVSDCKIVDKQKNILSESFFLRLYSGRGFWKNFIKNTYLGCCMAFRRDVLEYVLPFPENIAMHDIWIGLSVELNGKPIFLNEPLMLYRRHGSNVSAASEVSKNTLYYKISYRLNILYSLFKRKFVG